MARQRLQSDPANRRLFSHPRMAADLIRLLGDPWVDDLDLDRLERLPTEYVSNDLRTRRADLPWWAPFKPGTGRPAGAGVMFHIEFQSSPDAHMAERLLEYVALLPGELRRSGWMAAEGGRVVTHVPLVVYNGRAKWNAPLRLAEPDWAPPELRDLQPRLAGRLIDAGAYAGDDAADGNPARAVLALDAASGQGLEPALARAEALFSAADDQALWQSFAVWCHGILSPRLDGQLPTLANHKETTMLAEALRERDEMKIDEGRRGRATRGAAGRTPRGPTSRPPGGPAGGAVRPGQPALRRCRRRRAGGGSRWRRGRLGTGADRRADHRLRQRRGLPRPRAASLAQDDSASRSARRSALVLVAYKRPTPPSQFRPCRRQSPSQTAEPAVQKGRARSATKMSYTPSRRDVWTSRRDVGHHGAMLDITMQPLAANIPPTPRHTEISAPSTCAGAVPRICRTLSCKAYMPYMPECM